MNDQNNDTPISEREYWVRFFDHGVRTGAWNASQSEALMKICEKEEYPLERLSTVNPHFFAQLFIETQKPLWDTAERKVYLYNPESGLWIAPADDAISEQVSQGLLFFNRVNESKTGLSGLFSRKPPQLCAIVKVVRTKLIAATGDKNPFEDSAQRPVLHLKNGMLDLTKLRPAAEPMGMALERAAPQKVLEAFSPKWRSRRQMQIEYNPNARCPEFMKLLEKNLDRDDMSLLQRWAGLTLVGGNPAQKIMALHGDGGNGKGTVAQVLSRMMGIDRVGELRTAQLDGRFELKGYQPYSMLYGADVGKDFLSNSGATHLKKMVGGDTLRPESKGRDERAFIAGHWDVLITSNFPLSINTEGDKSSWLRRLILLHFHSETSAVQTPDYADTLFKTEGAGILNWLIEGNQQAWRELSSGQLQMTREQVEEVERVLMQSASLDCFMDVCVRRDENSSITVREMIEGYFAFCFARRWSPLSDHECSKKMKTIISSRFGKADAHSLSRDGKSARGWRGIRVVPEEVKEPVVSSVPDASVIQKVRTVERSSLRTVAGLSLAVRPVAKQNVSQVSQVSLSASDPFRLE